MSLFTESDSNVEEVLHSSSYSYFVIIHSRVIFEKNQIVGNNTEVYVVHIQLLKLEFM